MPRNCEAGADDGFALLRCRSIQPISVSFLALSGLVIGACLPGASSELPSLLTLTLGQRGTDDGRLRNDNTGLATPARSFPHSRVKDFKRGKVFNPLRALFVFSIDFLPPNNFRPLRSMRFVLMGLAEEPWDETSEPGP